jgi:hypothetical protein
MADQETQNSFAQIVTDYLRSRGEPRLRNQITLTLDAVALLMPATRLLYSAQRIVAMAHIFSSAYLDSTIIPQAWDDLVRDYPVEDMQVVRTIFPEDEWPQGIPYPNLVALVGHLDRNRAADKTEALAAIVRVRKVKGSRLRDIVILFQDAINDPQTHHSRWDQLVAGFEDADLEPVREYFSREMWPPERYSVPYPNLVAFAKWHVEKGAVQTLVMALTLSTVFGDNSMLNASARVAGA